MNTQDRLVQLASAVAERRMSDRKMSWALMVPTDGDDEWVIKLGKVEIVADKLDVALDIALCEVSS